MPARTPSSGSSPAAPRRATIRDVAEAAAVSKSLVSLAFKDPSRVSEERLSRIRDAALRLGYQPNLLAMSLAGDGVPFVAILVVNLHNPLFADIADAVRAELDLHGQYGLVTSATLPGRENRAASYGRIDPRVVGMLTDLHPRALIVIGTAHGDPSFSGIPTVYASAAPGPEATSVRADDRHGMELVVDHLRQGGRRRIAFVGGEAGPVSRSREQAYRAVMQAAGLSPDVRPAGFSEEDGLRAGRDLLQGQRRPDAIIAVNDLAAIGVLTAADELGASVPGELAVTGFDNISLSGLHRIRLTSVDPDNAAIGRWAATAALARIADASLAPEEELIRPRLVVRDTTGG